MSLEIWLAFVVTASVILFVPGPTVIYIVGQSLSHGRKASIPLTIGVLSGDALCIALSLLGLSTILSVCSAAFMVIKYLGAGYLVYLGVKMLISAAQCAGRQEVAREYNSKTLLRDVFFVNALNPKGIIFYSSFMPQFVTSENNMAIQFFVLALTFICLAFINVVALSLVASKASEVLQSMKFTRAFNFTGGVSLICAGVYSATLAEK